MKRSSMFLQVALAAAALAVSAFEHTVDVIHRTYRAAIDKASDLFFRAVDVIAAPKVETNTPEVRVIQAKAFQARIEKRERPQLTSGWRMCPST